VLGATTRVRGVWVWGACTRALVCVLGVLTLAAESDRVAVVVTGVTERGTAVRCPFLWGASLYRGDEDASGDTR